MRAGNKPQAFAPAAAKSYLHQLSKAAVIDIAWNLALLGTDESEEQMMARIVEEAEIVCKTRGDRLPKQRLAARGDA